MNHDDATELLALYALDALEGDESAEVEAHLVDCPRCASELDSLRGVAAAMGNATEAPPAHLWAKIAGHLYDAPSEAPALVKPASVTPVRPRRSRALIISWAAAAALVAVLALALGHANDRAARLQGALTASAKNEVLAALVAPGHHLVTLTGSHHRELAQMVTLPDGRAYLVSSRLPALAPTRTYQLWAIVAGRPISVGLLGPRPSLAAVTMSGARASVLAITDEPSGGSVTPTMPIVASTTL